MKMPAGILFSSMPSIGWNDTQLPAHPSVLENMILRIEYKFITLRYKIRTIFIKFENTKI